jgi:hypothetical protein
LFLGNGCPRLVEAAPPFGSRPRCVLKRQIPGSFEAIGADGTFVDRTQSIDIVAPAAFADEKPVTLELLEDTENLVLGGCEIAHERFDLRSTSRWPIVV